MLRAVTSALRAVAQDTESGSSRSSDVVSPPSAGSPKRMAKPTTARRRSRYKGRMHARQRQRVHGHRERKVNTSRNAVAKASKRDLQHELDAAFHRFLSANQMMEYAPGGASATVKANLAKRKAKSAAVVRPEAARFRLSLAEEKLFFAGNDDGFK
ncbi:uncharacterized protein AMSG_06676 [Thecamonas trahens ATCC 50062]|uniref:Uncharacterized protein n=1 Tax=Thecamonas trahens ATCC 50062 TaxID=461836 RepID=A0A0L0DEQ9_THETB|nr:hypothetical protein AMSG_06676 [Thecamonas trahens ATCC 50062]KNC50779.1 hypothetical protein AMSG_06676 [Thecamonas trahens ATCC 50062]|eukprot:XP_013756738.1 hypothetical protein AMSG_06676 [Thecamonas trahens ATCC 50062]